MPRWPTFVPAGRLSPTSREESQMVIREAKTGRNRGPVERAKINAAQAAVVAALVAFFVILAVLWKWAGG